MKKVVLAALCVFGTARIICAQSVTLNIDAGSLDNTLGTAVVPTGGLLQLIASPTGTFSAPNSASYVSGDNVLVASFAMNMNGNSGTFTGETFSVLNALPLTNTNGAVTFTNNNSPFTLGGNYTLTTSETLELRFYPSLTYTARPAAPTLGTSYGQVRSSTIEFGPPNVPTETAWVVPAAGSNVTFEYVTVSNGGTYSNASADATNLVFAGIVPEPSTYALLGCGLLGLVGLRLRNRRSVARF